MSREYGYQSEAQEPILWDRVEWRQGDGRYVFEVARGGLLATLSSPHGSNLTLPMVAWEGLLDALAAARKTKSRAERNLPSRTGARWSEGETQELVKTFKAGGSIAQLARVHNRTQFAVEAQLERQGLWDRAERRPTARVIGGDAPAAAMTAVRPIAAASVDGRGHDANGRPAPAATVDGQSSRTAVAAASTPLDPEQRTSFSPMDSRAPFGAAPVSGRRHDHGPEPSFGAAEADWPPVPAPAVGRRYEPSQQSSSGQTDAHPPFAPAPVGDRRYQSGRQPSSAATGAQLAPSAPAGGRRRPQDEAGGAGNGGVRD